jgi:xylulokinase
MKYLLGVDFGGGASKATLLCEDGTVTATSTKEYPTKYPHIGWAEQDPDDSYNALIFNIRSILCKSNVNPDNIVAIALDGATHTSVLLDKNDKVIRPAIYWTDRRSSKQSDRLMRDHKELLLAQTLNAPSPFWTLPQLIWLREEEPENFSRICKVLFLKDYVRFRLTGDYVTDSIEAMGSMLMDVPNNCWSEEICSLAGLHPNMMPEIVEPTTIISPLNSDVVRATGLSPQTSVIAGATDTVMEVYASGAIHKGQATVKLATAGRICSVTEKGCAHRLLVNYRHVVPGLWYPGTATKSCAASYRWYRDVLCTDEINQSKTNGVDPYILMDSLAEKISAGSDNLFFHPYLQGEITPYLDNDLRASFTGISSFHSKGHFNRAVMEGVAYSLKDCLQVMSELEIPVESASIIGGGSNSPLWRQIVADVLNIPLNKAKVDDSSLGSAMLAGVASGVFNSFEDSVDKCVRKDCSVIPNPENNEVYERGFLIYKQIHDAMAPVYKQIAKFNQ